MIKQNDLYLTITQKIINDLEQGKLTWRKPWDTGNLNSHIMRPLRWNGVPYSGINTIMLWSAAADNGYQSPYWMTYKQASDLKAHIRKGEKGTQVVYADSIERDEINAEGKTETQKIPFLKLYTVFNVNQIEGLPGDIYDMPQPLARNEHDRIESFDRFFQNTNAKITTGPEAAYYTNADRIEMPPFECFNSAEDYYAILAHETTHWTSHPSRLNRDFNRKRFGDEGYAKEELVAELGACFLGADLGFTPPVKQQHAAYIQGWLNVLKNDNRFIIQAASQAHKAVEFLTGLQQQEIAGKKAVLNLRPLINI